MKYIDNTINNTVTTDTNFFFKIKIKILLAVEPNNLLYDLSPNPNQGLIIIA